MTRLAILALSLLVIAPTAARAEGPDWNAVADVGTVEILTHDDEGEPAEITVWLAVVDGRGYVRTGDSSWRPFVERDPEIGLRIEGSELALRAVRVTDPVELATVQATFREKYGLSDWFVGLVFHGGEPVVWRLEPRTPAP